MIIAVTGRKNSGKDTASNFLVKNYKKFYKYSFAKPMKEMAISLFDWSLEQCNDGILKEIVDPSLGFSPRQFLQFIGTDIFQYEICKRFPLFAELQGRNFWVNKFVKFYHKMGSNSVNFTISDLRFPHEIETIKKLEKEVYVVKINRPCLDCNDSHESEKAIDSLKCDLVLDNDKDFDSLYKLIESTIWDLTTDEAGFPLDKN